MGCLLSACNFFSKKELILEAAPSSSLQTKTVCRKWRVVIALIPTTGCMTIVALGFFYQSYLVAIPAGTGLLFSLYPAYIAYVWDDANTFHQNNVEFGKNNTRLEGEISRLQEELTSLQDENENFRSNNAKLEEEVEDFKLTIEIQKKQWEEILSSSSQIQEKAKKNHEEFGDAIDVLKDTVNGLSDENERLENIVSELSQKFKQTLSVWVETLEEIKNWKKADKAFDEKISKLNSVNKLIEDAEKKVENCYEKLTILERSIGSKLQLEENLVEKQQKLLNEIEKHEEALKEATEALKKIQDGACEATEETKKQIKNLSTVINDLLGMVRKDKRNSDPLPLNPQRLNAKDS